MAFYKRFSFWFFVLVLLLIAFFIVNKTLRAVEVKTVKVEREDFTLTVTATSMGTIKADEEVRLTAQRVGRISRLLVKEGDIVKSGALCSTLMRQYITSV